MGADRPIMDRRTRGNGLDVNEIKSGIVWRIAIQMKKWERGYNPHTSSICDEVSNANAALLRRHGKPHREVGLSHQINRGLAVLLALLAALAGPRRLLLLLLTRLLLAAALLLSALLLTTLLLLARLLVWILIHLTILSNVGSKRHLGRSRSMARDNAWRLHSFPFTGPLNFDENVFGTRLRQCEFHIRIAED
jgi:hypothetical protein